jgi:hypothetical protein
MDAYFAGLAPYLCPYDDGSKECAEGLEGS